MLFLLPLILELMATEVAPFSVEFLRSGEPSGKLLKGVATCSGEKCLYKDERCESESVLTPTKRAELLEILTSEQKLLAAPLLGVSLTLNGKDYRHSINVKNLKTYKPLLHWEEELTRDCLGDKK